jgi:hypothetical protein
MVGQVNGRLKVLGYTEPHLITAQTILLVECQNLDCGHRKEMQVGNFKRAKRCTMCEGMRKDLTGLRSGKLEVIGFAYTEDWKAYWQCRCDCGEQVMLSTNDLTVDHQMSCGRCPRGRIDDGMRVRNRMILDYKANAQRTGVAWSLTADEVWTLIQGTCAYCAAPPAPRRLWEKDTRNRTIEFAVNGIGRVSCTVGYEKGNVVSCCSKCRGRRRGTAADQAG